MPTKPENAIGLANLTYVPPQSPMTREDWPTLREMLDSGKRLVVFIDKGADEKTVPYLLSQFPNVRTISLLLTSNLFRY
jgi:hypothetical protein